MVDALTLFIFKELHSCHREMKKIPSIMQLPISIHDDDDDI
jgi:hypothetical protein